MKPFRFKKFEVHQDKTAMKVGTDGVLLGAWTQANLPKNILDIGTGTGLIALMLAQRFDTSIIDALEVDKEAALQAAANFKSSNWRKRLTAINTALQDYRTTEKYDLIVSNPPYFDSIKKLKTAREHARQTASLPFEILLAEASELLTDTGELTLILPYESLENILNIAKQNTLFCYRICTVYGTEKSKPKRVLLQFSKIKKTLEETKLVIEISRHNYTEVYIALTQDFYLKM